jgi:hypothetical protein
MSRAMLSGDVGVLLEESITETVARAYMRDQFGLQASTVSAGPGPGPYGSYRKLIGDVQKISAEVAGSRQAGAAIWESACFAFKRNAATATGVADGLELFLEGFPAEHRNELRTRLRKITR